MSYYPPPNQGQDYSVAYYPPSNPGMPYGNEPPGQYNMPGPFPTEPYGGQYGPPGSYSPPQGQYGPPGSYPPPQGQYGPPPGQYPPPGGQYPPPGEPYGQGYGQPAYGGGGPIMNQPAQGDWMSMPPGIHDCPPGLEALMSLSSLSVRQKVPFMEVFTGFEEQNRFVIKNDRGDKLFWAVEDSGLISRNLLGQFRPFKMIVMDESKREVIRISRKARCTHCCFPCCLQVVKVYSPPGNLVGTIEQAWSILYPWFNIKDASGNTVLKIRGPCCALRFCVEASFPVYTADGDTKIGMITKDWSGLAREMFTDADFFGISFPQDLDVRMKAVLIGAVFLIDAMYFES